MASRFLDMLHLKGCAHEFSWPRRWPDGDFYQVCLVCGEEYKYDWKSMRRLEKITEARPAQHLLRRQGAVVRGKERHKQLSWTPRARRIKIEGKDILFRAKGAKGWQRGVVENISSSGVYFTCGETLSENAELEMFLEMPAEITGQKDSRVMARGMVVRAETPATPEGKPAIAAGIWDYRFVHRKPNPEPSTAE
jgi:hypothetical protein